ncbi:HTH_Tnp_Tc3_2 domain-containing protein [Trichonephila clavipes]|nr:HTH_Tnp_Tc3_2 domain-containing protein [Trichonephila clavipes]
MPRVRSRNAYQHVPDFDKGRIAAYRDCGLSDRSIAVHVGPNPVSVSRSCVCPVSVRNRWFQDGNTDHAVSQRSPITSIREDRHVIRIALMDRVPPSRALSQEFGSFARQQVSAQTVRRRLLQHGVTFEINKGSVILININI